MKNHLPFALAGLAGCLLLPTGCSVLQPKADPTRFYVLRASSASSQQALNTSETAAKQEIRLGPASVPSYLKATGIAVAAGPHEVDYLDLHHWAEPLDKGINRTLGENLARQLGNVEIVVYPDPFLAETGYEVLYTIDRFEGTLDGPVQLEVIWRVEKRPGGSVLASKRSVFTVPPRGGAKGLDAYVERLSQAIALWSQEIATAIREKTETAK
jgi:uncharacterized lipoprotein YmbA